MALSAHALRPVQITLKSVSNEGHFTLEAETDFSPYLFSHCSGMTEIWEMALSAQALEAVPVSL
jgi:hypothetical protein